MKILKIGLLASAFAMLLISCKTVAQNSTIESITLRNTYGRGGFTSITATKDSLTASSAGGRVTDYPNFNKKLNSKDWQKLVSAINISTLEKTKSGERRGHYEVRMKSSQLKRQKKNTNFITLPKKIKATNN